MVKLKIAIPELVWLVLVLLGTGIMSYQIIDRTIHYYGYPSDVSVQVNFNDTLQFPAVTLCNQNAFKATAAAADHRYSLIDGMYTKQGGVSVKYLESFNATNITIEDLYTRAAHKKEDLIVRCEFENFPCTAMNFSQTMTDHGVCFTFNGRSAGTSELKVANAGIDHGLRLVLNVEEYEYMPGPNEAAGMKIFIHDKEEFPLVRELGLAIPTGSHTFVGNSLFVFKNLPPPHGECGSKELTYFPANQTYSTAICKIDCFTVEMRKTCGCRHAYLPHINGLPPVCTLQQLYECGNNFTKVFQMTENEFCQCPIPCKFQVYAPSVSYAATSNFVISKLLPNINSKELQEKYIQARETTHLLELDKLNFFLYSARKLLAKLGNVDELLKRDIEKNLMLQKMLMTTMKSQIYNIWKRKDFINYYQKYVIQKNFLRARDAMEERTLHHIGQDFQVFIMNMNVKIRHLTNSSIGDPSFRRTVYTWLRDKVDIEVEMINRGIENLTELIDAYKNGTPIFSYQYSEMSVEDGVNVVPKKLLNNSLYRNVNTIKDGLYILEGLEILKESLKDYQNLTEVAYNNNTVDEDVLLTVGNNVADYSKAYFHYRANLYFESLEWPVGVMDERISLFTDLWTHFSEIFDRVQDNMDLINSSLKEIQHNIGSTFHEMAEVIHLYPSNTSVRKLDVADVILSRKIRRGTNTMKVCFQDLRSRGQSVFDGWAFLTHAAVDIWRAILTDEDSTEYYAWKGYEDFLQNLSTVQKGIDLNFTIIRDIMDIRDVIGNKDRTFYSSLDDMINLMRDYWENTRLGSKFLKQNFVFLDVFYNQLNYEQVIQQEDYTIFSLLCDIGGSLGLFIGASALSLFEIVDVFIDLFIKKLLGIKQKPNQ